MRAIALLLLLAVATVYSSPVGFESDVLALLKGAQEEAAQEAHVEQGVSLIDSGADMTASISTFLQSMKQQNEDTFKALLLEQSQHQAVEQEISKQHSALKERGAFLQRLQSCITEGPTEAKLKAEADALFHRETALMKAAEEVARQRKETAAKESSFVAQEELAHRKLSAVEAALAQEEKSKALLAAKAEQLGAHAALLAKSETELATRVEVLNHREEMLARREQDLIARVQAMRVKHDSVAQLRERAREHSFLQVNDTCSAATSCAACTAAAGCAWCASSADGAQGSCLAHNVNAESDGLTAGTCTVKNWFSKVADRVTTLSLNIHGSDFADREQRAAAIFNVIISAKYPDFVALQDVADWFLEYLKMQSWFASYYHMTSYPAKDGLAEAPGGLVILSRFPVGRTVYAAQRAPQHHAQDQSPRVLIADFQIAGRTLTVATTNLDWRSADSRVEALRFVAGVTDAAENLVLLGDFKFDAGVEPETSAISSTWIDVWPRVHTNATGATRGPNKFGYTWDPVANLYARMIDSQARAARIDRVFVRSTLLRPRTIEVVGCPAPDYLCQDPPSATSADNALPYHLEPVDEKKEPVIFPAPHFGLLADFSLLSPHC